MALILKGDSIKLSRETI